MRIFHFLKPTFLKLGVAFCAVSIAMSFNYLLLDLGNSFLYPLVTIISYFSPIFMEVSYCPAGALCGGEGYHTLMSFNPWFPLSSYVLSCVLVYLFQKVRVRRDASNSKKDL